MWIVVNGGGSKRAGPFDTYDEAFEVAEHWNNFWGSSDYRARKVPA